LCEKQHVAWNCKERKCGGTSASRERMVRWMCGIKLKLASKELTERLGIDDSIGFAAEQAALVWACAVKR